ncbi:MAG TPA: hypothetical protein VMV29_24630 [Ktedonobacterales bacterium]|nr:hypothetical protein [Ktedonobacterales bacterium]
MPKTTANAMNAQAAITAKLASDDPDHSLLLTGLATLADVLQHEVDELRAKGVGEANAVGHAQRRGEAALPQDDEDEQLRELQTFVYRIRQIYDWLKQDARLIPIVDDAIGKRVRELERKQEQVIARQNQQNYALAIVTTLVGAILGWLISLLGTPASLVHAIIH